MKACVNRTTNRIGLWAILIILTCTTACSELAPFTSPVEGGAMPEPGRGQGSPSLQGQTEGGLSQDQGQAVLDFAQSPLTQDVPPMPPMDVITVDLEGAVSQQEMQAGFLQCPTLDAMLVPVVDAPDPLEMAKALNMQVKGRKIQVALVLDGADTAFLKEFDAEISTRSGDEIQAYVPVDRLCDLANHERVLALYPPHQGVTQQ